MAETYSTSNDILISKIELKSHISDNSFSILDLVQSFSISEDLFENTTGCNINIKDSLDVSELFPIIGGESVSIVFQTDKESDKIEYNFIVVNIDNKSRDNETTYTYTLDCVSKELLLSEKTFLSKSYKNAKTSDIVRRIYSDFGVKDIEIDPTLNIQHFVIPRWTPFKAINWLATQAHSPEYNGAGFLFYEDKDSFKFKSIEALMAQEPVETLDYTIQNTKPKVNEEGNAGSSIEKFTILTKNDMIALMCAGAYGSTVVSIDPVVKKAVTDEWSFNRINEELDLGGRFPSQQSDFEYADPRAKIAVGFTKSHRRKSAYVKQTGTDDFSSKPETSTPTRSAIDALFNESLMVSVTTQGNTNLTVGKTIEINIPILSGMSVSERTSAKTMSGKYLIIECTHNVQQNRDHKMELLLAMPFYNSEPRNELDV